MIPQRKVCKPPERPLLWYYGGKWNLADWTISLMPDHRGYCEPFGGAASILLKKQRCHTEIYNDLDSEIVNLFRILRNRRDELIELVRYTPMSRVEFDLSYDACADELEQARRTVVRSMLGFSGVSTHGNSSSFTPGARIAAGTSTADQWIDLTDHLYRCADRLRSVVIECAPAIEILERYDDPAMLFYVDPPYVGSTRNGGNANVYRHEMNDADHEQLASKLFELSAMVMVAGYRCDLYDNIFSGWNRIDKVCNSGRATKRTECIWTRNIEQRVQELNFT